MAHGCIANPCWICYPQLMPEHMKNKKLDLTNESVDATLLAIFQRGLNKNTQVNENDFDLQEIKMARSLLLDNTLDARLLDLIIEFVENKNVNSK